MEEVCRIKTRLSRSQTRRFLFGIEPLFGIGIESPGRLFVCNASVKKGSSCGIVWVLLDCDPDFVGLGGMHFDAVFRRAGRVPGYADEIADEIAGAGVFRDQLVICVEHFDMQFAD